MAFESKTDSTSLPTLKVEKLGDDDEEIFRPTPSRTASTDASEPDSSFNRNDRRDMFRMGKKQEFIRGFQLISSIGFTSCVMGTWEILLATNTPALMAGGTAGWFWSMVWVYVGQTFVVLSLAEMASMAPTAGGQYHWVSEFAPRQHQRILSYISGWLSTLCWQAFVLSDCFIIATNIQSMISLNNTSYVPERWHQTLLCWAVAVFIGIFNAFGAKRLPLAEGIFVTFHFCMFVPIIIPLWVGAQKASAKDVFLKFTDNGAGWPNMALTVLVGQVSAMFTVLGSDSVAHMSEEVRDAGLIVPRSMLWAYLINIPFAFGVLITFVFCAGDVNEAIKSGSPYVYAFLNATNTAGATGLTFIMFILLMMVTISTFASTTRQVFAFARDGGFPFSSFISKVNVRFKAPINAAICTSLFTMLISLINIGSTAAFNAFISLGVVALMATYLISIGCILFKRVKHPEELPFCRWSLGKYGPAINSCALIYATWSFFWAFWPNVYMPTVESLNWSPVIFVGVMIISTIWYFVAGKRTYEGPVATVQGREFE